MFNCSQYPIYEILNKNKAISKDVLMKARKEKAPHNKITICKEEKNKVIDLYKNKEKSVKEIKMITKIPTSIIYKILEENGIDRKGNKYYLDEISVIKDYKSTGSSNDTAKKYDCSARPILRILKKHKINFDDYQKESPLKGKTIEEYHGKEKAEELRKKSRENRSKQVFPVKDTSIELKIQDF